MLMCLSASVLGLLCMQLHLPTAAGTVICFEYSVYLGDRILLQALKHQS